MTRNLLVLPTGEELFSGVVGENAISSVKLTRCVNSEEELTPGAVCASMLEASVIVQKPLSLTAGDEVTLYTVSDSGDRKQEGVFIAEKPVWESNNRYTLTAYDRISRLDKDLTNWLAGLTGWPYYLLDFANMVCAECGLELITQEIPNGDYSVQAFSAEGITGRQLMQWVGQAAGRFCRATKDGQIEFSWYREAGITIGSGEKIIQVGPESMVVLDEMQSGMPLQAVSEIKPSLSAKTSAKLYRRGRNILDLQTAGVYHSNDHTVARYSMEITDTGIRFSVTRGAKAIDRTLWGFCLGTVKELAGETITVSADYTTSLTGAGAIPCLGFFGVDAEPVTTPRDEFSSLIGGFLYSGSFKQLAYNSGQGVRSVTYRVTGQETQKYIAVLFAFGDPSKTSTAMGDWTQWDNIQVEYSDTPSAYQPYSCDVFTRSFSAIYGGSLDWSTGILTVTHGKIASYAGQAIPDGWISNTGQLSSGAQVVYPLAEAYTVQLTPQLITALDGYNYLWSNTGNTTAGFHQNYYFQNSLSFEDYAVAPVEKVQVRLTEEDVGAVYPDDPEKTNTYILSGNYLLTNADAQALDTVAQVLYEELKDITYTPCKIEVPASVGVDAGDIVTVTDKNGREITVYVMDRTVTGQRSKLECTGSPRRDSTTAVNAQSYKALSGKVLELRTDVEGLKAENKDAAGNLAKLALTVDGINSEVSVQKADIDGVKTQMTSLQETADKVQISVQSILDNGASKVSTEFGLTIDESAVQIHRSNSAMTNVLNENGMYVVRDKGNSTETVMLQADANGVVATDVSVNNYLVIGDYARFEDYTNRRTACFWLGGKE